MWTQKILCEIISFNAYFHNSGIGYFKNNVMHTLQIIQKVLLIIRIKIL